MQAPSDEKSYISIALEKNENECVIELSADIGSLAALRQETSMCFAALAETLGQECTLEIESPCPRLMLDIPAGEGEDYSSLYKIVVIGPFASGKSMLLDRYVRDISRPQKATIGVNFDNKDVNLNGNVIRLQLWDTCGNTHYQGMMGVYMRESAGIVLTVDWTRGQSDFLTEVELLFREYILRFTDFPKTPIILVGTKSDSVRHTEINRQVLETFSEKLGIPYIECSARTGANVSDVFEMLAKMIFTQQRPRYALRIKVRPVNPELLLNAEFNARLYEIVQKRISPCLNPVISYDTESMQYQKTVSFFKEKKESRVSLKALIHFYLKCSDSESLIYKDAAESALMDFQKENPLLMKNVADQLISNLTSSGYSERRDSRQLLEILSHYMDQIILRKSIINSYLGYLNIKSDTDLLLDMIADAPLLEEGIDKLLRILFFSLTAKGISNKVKLMIEHCDVLPTIRNEQGKDAAVIASENGHADLAQYLTDLIRKRNEWLRTHGLQEESAVAKWSFQSLFKRK